MKNKYLIFFRYIFASVALMSLLSGCFVTSVHPFYSKKDVYFDPMLIGSWGQAGSDKSGNMTFTSFEDRAYKMSFPGDGGVITFDAFLFKINAQTFLDVLPCERNSKYEPDLPMHYIIRISGNSSKIEMRVMNYEWLDSLIKTNTNVIEHVLVPAPLGQNKEAGFVLTADTVKLQRFIIKYQNELFSRKQKSKDSFFIDNLELIRFIN